MRAGLAAVRPTTSPFHLDLFYVRNVFRFLWPPLLKRPTDTIPTTTEGVGRSGAREGAARARGGGEGPHGHEGGMG